MNIDASRVNFIRQANKKCGRVCGNCLFGDDNIQNPKYVICQWSVHAPPFQTVHNWFRKTKGGCKKWESRDTPCI